MAERDADQGEVRQDGTTTEADSGAAGASDIERRARLMGWKDKSEFDRPPERWVDAATFVERGETILPVLKQNLHQMEDRLGATATELASTKTALTSVQAELAANSAALQHLRDLSITAETRAFERAKAEVAKERRDAAARLDAATAQADTAGARVAAADLAALRDPEPPRAAAERTATERTAEAERTRTTTTPAATTTTDAAEQAAVDAFVRAESSWFKRDPEATAYASALYGTLQQSRPGIGHAERLAEVRKSVTKRFPELFHNPNRDAAPRVAEPSGQARPAPRRGWTFEDLPQDVRAVCDKTVTDVNKGNKSPKKYTRQDYVDMYFAGQEKTA